MPGGGKQIINGTVDCSSSSSPSKLSAEAVLNLASKSRCFASPGRAARFIVPVLLILLLPRLEASWGFGATVMERSTLSSTWLNVLVSLHFMLSPSLQRRSCCNSSQATLFLPFFSSVGIGSGSKNVCGCTSSCSASGGCPATCGEAQTQTRQPRRTIAVRRSLGSSTHRLKATTPKVSPQHLALLIFSLSLPPSRSMRPPPKQISVISLSTGDGICLTLAPTKGDRGVPGGGRSAAAAMALQASRGSSNVPAPGGGANRRKGIYARSGLSASGGKAGVGPSLLPRREVGTCHAAAPLGMPAIRERTAAVAPGKCETMSALPSMLLKNSSTQSANFRMFDAVICFIWAFKFRLMSDCKTISIKSWRKESSCKRGAPQSHRKKLRTSKAVKISDVREQPPSFADQPSRFVCPGRGRPLIPSCWYSLHVLPAREFGTGGSSCPMCTSLQ
mmetsp:Transcript_11337/g.30499  ORF Transcript_11337/g.30499 Transcript_11337/m.30499 type:complete len:447 (+) Transcript_11337:2284-3624(+)